MKKPVEFVSSDNHKRAASLFREGKIGIFPTDTVFGVGCALGCTEAIKRLYRIKKRPHTQPTALLLDSLDQVRSIGGEMNPLMYDLINRFWPGGLTLIVPCDTKKLPSLVRGQGETVGIRVPDHNLLRRIIKDLGEPLVATSANVKGGKTPVSLKDIKKSFVSFVDFVIEGEALGKQASTVVKIQNGEFQILRQGAVVI